MKGVLGRKAPNKRIWRPNSVLAATQDCCLVLVWVTTVLISPAEKERAEGRCSARNAYATDFEKKEKGADFFNALAKFPICSL
jgi:hypothetical protein